MDNASRWYSQQYQIARGLADKGDRLKALEICWDLRNDQNISLYRRALVNLLIARIADIRRHPDKSKFAREAISLVAQVRRNFSPLDAESDHELKSIESTAERRLIAIEHEKRIWAAMKGKSKDEALQARAAVLAEIEREKEVTITEAVAVNTVAEDKIGADTKDIKMGETKDEQEQKQPSFVKSDLDPYTIEESFTDYGRGQRSTSIIGTDDPEEQQLDEDNNNDEQEQQAVDNSARRGETEELESIFGREMRLPPSINVEDTKDDTCIRTPLQSSPPASPNRPLSPTKSLSLRISKEGGDKSSALSVNWTSPMKLTYSEALKAKLKEDKEDE